MVECHTFLTLDSLICPGGELPKRNMPATGRRMHVIAVSLSWVWFCDP
jgi:hypothetical protein